LSSVAEPEWEAAARAAGEQFMFQLYADGDESWVLDTAEKAADLGCKALCVTVDVPTFGRRERHLHRRQVIAGRPFGGLRHGEANRGRSDWSLIERLRRAVDVPLMVKGIQTAEDAALAHERGVDVVYVSNHGGRQLYHFFAAVAALYEVLSALCGMVYVFDVGGYELSMDHMHGV